MSEKLQERLEILQRQLFDFKQKGALKSENGKKKFDILMQTVSLFLRDTYVALKEEVSKHETASKVYTASKVKKVYTGKTASKVKTVNTGKTASKVKTVYTGKTASNVETRPPWIGGGNIQSSIEACISVQDPGDRITQFLQAILPQQQQNGGALGAVFFLLGILGGIIAVIAHGIYVVFLNSTRQAILYVYKLITKQKDESRFLMYILIILSMKPGLTDAKKEEITKLWSKLVGHLVSTKSMYLVSYYGLILRFLTGGDGKVERGQLPDFVTAAAEDIETPDEKSSTNVTVYYSNIYKFKCYPPEMYDLSHKAAGFRMMAAEIQLHMAYQIRRRDTLSKKGVTIFETNVVEKMNRETDQVHRVIHLLSETDIHKLLKTLQDLTKEEEIIDVSDEPFDADKFRSVDVNILDNFKFRNEKNKRIPLYIPVNSVRGGATKEKKKLSPYNIFVAKHRREGKSMKEVGALWQKNKQ